MPIVTRIIILVNIGLFTVAYFLFSGEFQMELALYFPGSIYFKPYQIFSCMFMHAGWLHLIVNMIALASFGNIVERVLGSNKYLLYYLLAGIGGSLFVLLVGYIQVKFFGFNIDCTDYQYQIDKCVKSLHPVIGASGAIAGIFAIFCLIAPDAPLQIILIPVSFRANSALWGFTIISFLGILHIFPSAGLSHEGHLGGLLMGILLYKSGLINK